jgi:hypothetical protein
VSSSIGVIRGDDFFQQRQCFLNTPALNQPASKPVRRFRSRLVDHNELLNTGRGNWSRNKSVKFAAAESAGSSLRSRHSAGTTAPR